MANNWEGRRLLQGKEFVISYSSLFSGVGMSMVAKSSPPPTSVNERRGGSAAFQGIGTRAGRFRLGKEADLLEVRVTKLTGHRSLSDFKTSYGTRGIHQSLLSPVHLDLTMPCRW